MIAQFTYDGSCLSISQILQVKYNTFHEKVDLDTKANNAHYVTCEFI